MNLKCSKCGEITNYDGDLHCRNIFVNEINKFLSLSELTKARDLYLSISFDGVWKEHFLSTKVDLWRFILAEEKRAKAEQHPQSIDFNNRELKEALRFMNETEDNIFLTGSAGTGKSTAIEYFRENTKKRIIVLAPTGVAALNIGGETIHSFFHFGIDITPDSIRRNDLQNQGSGIYKNIDTIVIDEVSMVRADLLDCVDKFMRLNGKDANKPFGGVQVILVGDPYQLPPVVTENEEELVSSYQSPNFFDSKVYDQANFNFIELKEIYRQQNDEKFIQILETLRLGESTEQQLELINTRYSDKFVIEHDLHINLMSTNAVADLKNNRKLSELPTKLHISHAVITGMFNRNLPTNAELRIKEGSKVMFVKNDQDDRWVNGDLGEIIKIDEENNQIKEILVKLKNGLEYIVTRNIWEKIKFFYNKNTNLIETQVIGTFEQFPLRLAWAVTIHKGQGKTYENVVVNFGRGTFAHGQAYVAISRCKNLDGLFLTTPLRKEDILIDKRVCEFMKKNLADNELTSIVSKSENPTEIEEKFIEPEQYKKLESLMGQQRQELNEHKKFLSDIAPLLDKLDQGPEIIRAIINGDITAELAKAAEEGRVSIMKKKIEYIEYPEVEINPKNIPF